MDSFLLFYIILGGLFMHAFFETRSYETDIPVSAFYQYNNNFRAHWHVDVEMIYVCEGSIRICINKDLRILNKGEIAVINSMDIHYYDSKGLTSKIIVLVFRPEWIGVTGFSSIFIKTGMVELIDKQTYHDIVKIFYKLVDELRLQNEFYEFYVKGKMLELCTLIFRCFQVHHADFDKKEYQFRDIEKIQKAIKYLENNYMFDISLSDISKEVNLNPSYFSRLFSKFSGTGFKAYLNRVRIDNAEYMLKNSKEPIIDICFKCGFNSVRTFNRIFKSVKGYTPSDSRKNFFSNNK